MPSPPPPSAALVLLIVLLALPSVIPFLLTLRTGPPPRPAPRRAILPFARLSLLCLGAITATLVSVPLLHLSSPSNMRCQWPGLALAGALLAAAAVLFNGHCLAVLAAPRGAPRRSVLRAVSLGNVVLAQVTCTLAYVHFASQAAVMPTWAVNSLITILGTIGFYRLQYVVVFGTMLLVALAVAEKTLKVRYGLHSPRHPGIQLDDLVAVLLTQWCVALVFIYGAQHLRFPLSRTLENNMMCIQMLLAYRRMAEPHGAARDANENGEEFAHLVMHQ